MSAKTQVATIPDPVDPVTAAWDEATADASLIVSYDVAKDEYLEALIGVDMVITGVTYRPGMNNGAYVSLECMLTPAFDLKRINRARTANGYDRLESLDEMPWDPGENIIINNGGAGIYRQVTEILAATGAIRLKDPITPGGKRGESSFDATPNQWDDVITGNMMFDVSGNAVYRNSVIRVRARKGIRVSTYTFDDRPATTFYIA